MHPSAVELGWGGLRQWLSGSAAWAVVKAQPGAFAAFAHPLAPLTAQAAPTASILRFNTAGVNGICLRYDPESEQPDDVKAVPGMTPRQIPD